MPITCRLTVSSGTVYIKEDGTIINQITVHTHSNTYTSYTEQAEEPPENTSATLSEILGKVEVVDFRDEKLHEGQMDVLQFFEDLSYQYLRHRNHVFNFIEFGELLDYCNSFVPV